MREKKRERQTEEITRHIIGGVSKKSIASMACFPKHNLTVCPHELHFPLQEKTKWTQSGVLFADVKSPWIRSIRSALSKKGEKHTVVSVGSSTSKQTPYWRRTGQKLLMFPQRAWMVI